MESKAEKLRVDKYLWSIRLYKTRAQAADACDKGRVKLNGEAVKASRTVKIGDQYEAKTENRKWLVEVTALLDHRVAYAEAIRFYTDITPPEDLAKNDLQVQSFFTGKRLSKTGRPTRQQRDNRNEILGD